MKSEITLSAAIDGYLLHADARGLSPHTISDYTTTYNKLLQFLGADPPLQDITADDIRRFLASNPRVKRKTRLNYHTGLSALWRWAKSEGIVPDNVVRQVEPPHAEKTAIQPFTQDDIRAMLAACDYSQPYSRPGKRECVHRRPTALRDRAIILILLDTGMRASELCNLEIRDFDQRNKRISIRSGKGGKDRSVYVGATTAAAIWKYLAGRKDAYLNDPLFASELGYPISRGALLKSITHTGQRAGVLNAHPHRFRHTFAIQFLRAGGNVYTLQRLLGHSTMDMVKTYLHLADQDDSDNHRRASPVSNWHLR
jgi:site-specific recombinase XerD